MIISTFAVLLVVLAPAAEAGHYPVRVTSCGQEVIIDHRPRCAVFHDVNIAEMGFALGVQPEICALSGITGWSKATASFRRLRGMIPEIAPKYPSLEQIIASRADLFVAGWNYGMYPGGDVTPERLARYHIPVIVLSESCMRQMSDTKPVVTLDALLYKEIYRLGTVFDQEDKARTLIAEFKARVAAVQSCTRQTKDPRVFVYDSGQVMPITAGKYALASRLIQLAGGRNIMDDLPTNWGVTSWETVLSRRPDVIVLVDYGSGTDQSRRFMTGNRLLRTMPAVSANRMYTLPYDALTPGPANIAAIETLAAWLHPECAKK